MGGCSSEKIKKVSSQMSRPESHDEDGGESIGISCRKARRTTNLDNSSHPLSSQSPSPSVKPLLLPASFTDADSRTRSDHERGPVGTEWRRPTLAGGRVRAVPMSTRDLESS